MEAHAEHDKREEAGMMFCQNCGDQLEEGSVFCMNCGAKVVQAGAEPEAKSTPPESVDISKSEPSLESAAVPQPSTDGVAADRQLIMWISRIVVAVVSCMICMYAQYEGYRQLWDGRITDRTFGSMKYVLDIVIILEILLLGMKKLAVSAAVLIAIGVFSAIFALTSGEYILFLLLVLAAAELFLKIRGNALKRKV